MSAGASEPPERSRAPQAHFAVRALAAGDEEGCISVVRSLPEWFGYPGAVEGIRDALGSQRGFVVPADDGAIAAFTTVRVNFDECLEITYLAVHARWRGSGLGTALVSAVGRLCLEEGHRVVCLLTLGPSAESPHYQQTVAFYRSRGFAAVRECRLTEWNGAPALLMAAESATLAVLVENGPAGGARPRRC